MYNLIERTSWTLHAVLSFSPKEAVMQDHILFSIGFRCESVYESLLKYKQAGETVNQRMIDESLALIQDCFKFQKSVASLFSQREFGLAEFPPLVFDLYAQKKPEEIVAELQNVKDILERLAKKEISVNVDKALEFFRGLSKLCLRRHDEVNISFTPMLSLSF
jgi:hypothetical protein